MQNKTDVWDLIRSNLFEEACLKADADFEEYGSLLSLRNKVYALFHLEKFSEAVLLLNKIIQAGGKSASDFIFLGIALWILDKKEEAILNWFKSDQTNFQDAAGGLDGFLLIYFASIRLNDDKLKKEAMRSIKKKINNKTNYNWPSPLTYYLLGRLNEDQLKTYVDIDTPILRERQLCQMDFIIGIKLLENGDLFGYKQKLIESIHYSENAYLQKFFYLAKAEAKLLSNLQ